MSTGDQTNIHQRIIDQLNDIGSKRFDKIKTSTGKKNQLSNSKSATRKRLEKLVLSSILTQVFHP